MSVTTIGAIAAARRPRWQYPPPPPSPRILHLPRRTRRRPPSKVRRPPPPPREAEAEEKTGKLEALFGRERAFAKQEVPIVVFGERRRERVEEIAGGGAAEAVAEEEEERWRFQAEMLRAECSLMRMEKEIAVKKMERVRVKSLRALGFVVHSLVSERKKISEGKNSNAELEEEIQRLAEKLEKLRSNMEVKNPGLRRKCHGFNKQVANIQSELKMFRGNSDEICVMKIREMAEVSLSVNTMCNANETAGSSDDSNVEILRRKMEGLSSGMLLERMKEECGSMLSTANSSVASSASTSKRIELVESLPDSSIQNPNKEMVSSEENVCSGRCKAVVRRILEQVRAETEQWSQMQEMLGQVREEMEELQASRDFWEDRALDYDYQMQSLHSDVQEWRQKAILAENRSNQLEAQMYFLKKELKWSRKEENKAEDTSVKLSPPRIAVDGQHAMEKRVLLCRFKENQNQNRNNNNNNNYQLVHGNVQIQSSSNKQKDGFQSDGRRRKTHTQRTIGLVASERLPLKDIGNSCVSFDQQSKAIFPLMPSRTSKKF